MLTGPTIGPFTVISLLILTELKLPGVTAEKLIDPEPTEVNLIVAELVP